ncbi:hypothetical protein M0Q50_03465 [bacterium]|jgi:Ca2+-dependent lipid-binding protein|nr:hypothetical protein [bacterium]
MKKLSIILVLLFVSFITFGQRTQNTRPQSTNSSRNTQTTRPQTQRPQYSTSSRAGSITYQQKGGNYQSHDRQSSYNSTRQDNSSHYVNQQSYSRQSTYHAPRQDNSYHNDHYTSSYDNRKHYYTNNHPYYSRHNYNYYNSYYHYNNHNYNERYLGDVDFYYGNYGYGTEYFTYYDTYYIVEVVFRTGVILSKIFYY